MHLFVLFTHSTVEILKEEKKKKECESIGVCGYAVQCNAEPRYSVYLESPSPQTRVLFCPWHVGPSQRQNATVCIDVLATKPDRADETLMWMFITINNESGYGWAAPVQSFSSHTVSAELRAYSFISVQCNHWATIFSNGK